MCSFIMHPYNGLSQPLRNLKSRPSSLHKLLKHPLFISTPTLSPSQNSHPPKTQNTKLHTTKPYWSLSKQTIHYSLKELKQPSASLNYQKKCHMNRLLRFNTKYNSKNKPPTTPN